MHPDIAQTGSAKNGIYQCMCQHICIRMSQESHRMLNLFPPQDQFASLLKSMSVKSLAYSQNLSWSFRNKAETNSSR